MNLKRKEPKQLGINTKAFKKDEIKSEADNKKQLVKELHSCMKCKYFWGNDNRCINNKKCGSQHRGHRTRNGNNGATNVVQKIVQIVTHISRRIASV